MSTPYLHDPANLRRRRIHDVRLRHEQSSSSSDGPALLPPAGTVDRVDASLGDEIAAAESLVAQLGTVVQGSGRSGRFHDPDGKSDDDLLREVRSGSDAALAELLHKYRAFARVKARSYFLVGADREDVVQEGMIGLFKAIRDFDPDREVSFRVFAELCITRQMITAIKTATRQKH